MGPREPEGSGCCCVEINTEGFQRLDHHHRLCGWVSSASGKMLGREQGRVLLFVCFASMAMPAGAFSATAGSVSGRGKLLGYAMTSQSSSGRRRPPAARGGGRRARGGVLETRCNLEVWQPGKPVAYIEPVFRPPAEAGSLILQVSKRWLAWKHYSLQMMAWKHFKALLLDACRNPYHLTGALGSVAGATGHEWMQLEQVHLLRHVHLGGQGVSPEAPREDRGGTDRDLCHEHAHQAHLPGRWRRNDPSSQEVKGFLAPPTPQMQTIIRALAVRQTADLRAVPRIHQVERHTAAHQQARNTKAPAGIYPPFPFPIHSDDASRLSTRPPASSP